MKPHWVMILTAGFLTAADPPKSDAAPSDKDRLQGTWSAVSMENNGKPAPPEAIKGAKLVFTGDQYTLKGEESYQGTFTLDPTRKPKTIDTTFVEVEGGKKGTALGIYELEGDRLKICWRHGGKERPTEFATKPNSGLRLMVLKRDKP
jgi:uncharacterized protein (TIGR03067 family)